MQHSSHAPLQARVRFVCLALLIGALLPAALHAAPSVQLARDGAARQPVIVHADAPEQVRAAANTLADYLGRITGGDFTVQAPNGDGGVVVGLNAHIEAIDAETLDADSSVRAKEQYVLRSHDDGLYVVGATPLAVRHAVWDLLHRMGHRQYFPPDAWEIVPDKPNLSIAVDAVAAPDYLTRHIRYNYGTWDHNEDTYNRWRRRNRMISPFRPRAGHIYGAIIRHHQAKFDKHPEYYAKVDGERRVRPGAKLCISNSQVRQLAVEYALDHFENRPDADNVSMDPSDGGGWCQCEPCRAIGPPSNRALLLANTVAEALDEHGIDKPVAMYAYNYHSPPPTRVRAHEDVIVLVATAFLKKGLTAEKVLEGWRQMGVQRFGIRGYYSIYAWDRNLPGAARGSRLDYLKHTIPHFYSLGARFMDSESGDAWGSVGLGHYLASRMLWDVDEAKHVDEQVDRFLSDCFGAARAPMARFYELIGGDDRVLMSDDLIARMYRLLDEATKRAESSAVQKRLDALILYTRYVELYHAFDTARGDAKQKRFEDVVRFAYRIRDTGMVHSKNIYRSLDGRTGMDVPKEAEWNVPEAENPWKNSEPFTRNQIDQMVRQGIEAHKLRGFEQKRYSRDLVPAKPLDLGEEGERWATRDEPFTLNGRQLRRYYTWIDEAPRTIELEVTGGLISHYQDRGPVQIKLLRPAQADGSEPTVLDHAEVPPDAEPRDVTLRSEHTGLHVVSVHDHGDRTRVIWPADLPVTYRTSMDETPMHVGRRGGVFYVPRGTEMLGGYNARPASSAQLLNPEGDMAVNLTEADGYFSVAVDPAHTGRLWRRHMIAGDVYLMTVPPYVAPSAEDLLLPRELVERETSND